MKVTLHVRDDLRLRPAGRPVVWRQVWTLHLPFGLAVQFGREW